MRAADVVLNYITFSWICMISNLVSLSSLNDKTSLILVFLLSIYKTCCTYVNNCLLS
jgi:hypothetical protein